MSTTRHRFSVTHERAGPSEQLVIGWLDLADQPVNLRAADTLAERVCELRVNHLRQAAEFTLEDQAEQSTPTPAPNSPPVAGTRARANRGIYIPLDASGQLDANRVRCSADVERVRVALTGVGEKKEEAPKEVKPIDIKPETILTAYSLLEVVIQKAGKFFLKWPVELVEEMQFSPEKKQALVQPTTAVIQKYSHKLGWLAENQEVAALCMALGEAVDDMVQKGAQRYVAKVRAAQNPQPPPPPTPIPNMSSAPAPDMSNGAAYARVSN
jgi:hypothetical protein